MFFGIKMIISFALSLKLMNVFSTLMGAGGCNSLLVICQMAQLNRLQHYSRVTDSV